MFDRPSNPPLRRGAIAAAVLCLPGAALHAQSVEPNLPTVLDPVVVTGSIGARRVADAPYAISVIDAEQLRAGGPMVNLSEALSRVPGLIVANRNNYAQDQQISSRGFGARAGFGVRGLRLFTDGIPATMPDGQGQVTHFDIAGAQRIEVLRGPYSALYGSASGGVIALFTAPATERRVGLDADVGSFGMRQGRFSIAAPLDAVIGKGWDLKASFSHLRVDGFRPHEQAERSLGNVRLGYTGADDKVVLLASDITQNANDPLGLTRAQINANPDQTTPEATNFDTRKTARQTQLGARWTHAFDKLGPLSESALTGYFGNRGVTQWQAIPVATQTPVRSAGGVIDYDRLYRGVDARLVWRWEIVELVTGVAVETQTDERRGYENFTGTGSAQQLGVTGRLRREETDKVMTQDVYAQGEMALAKNVSATLGVRSGKIRYEVFDRYLSNGNDSGSLQYDYTTPVLGLRWKPTTQWTLSASAARGFEAPTQAELAYQPSGAAGFNFALQPQKSRQAEIGARFSEAGFNAQVSVVRIETSNEIGVATNSGGRSSFQNVGRTKRSGLELGLQATVTPALKAQASLTWLNASYRDSFNTCTAAPCTLTSATNTATVPGGNKIAGTARSNAFGELAWQPWMAQPTIVAVEWRAQGRMAVNDLNADFAGGWGEAALRLSHRWKLGAGTNTADGGSTLELLARVDNLTDRRHVGSVIVNDGNARFFEPAAPRSGLISLRYGMGF